jgi:glutamyl-tRNA synthetase
MDVTRLAPSPTGALHLGNARTFLVNWAIARRHGWQVVLRIEDLDGPRVKLGADRAAIEDLRWLGIDWDSGPVRQSERAALYKEAADRLVAAGAAYPCVCTRKEVESAASAPHAEDGSAVYPGTCRGRFASVAAARAATGREPAIRFRVPADESAVVEWQDAFRGPQRFDARDLGDFVITKADGTAAYQLAVVVDDVDAGVTQVVRGDDLVDSTPRQMLLYRALGWGDRIPAYSHLPLVTGPDGRRLAKRHGDTRLSYYRSLAVPADRVVALLARWCGIPAAGESCSANGFADRFMLDALPPSPVVMSVDAERFLRGKEPDSAP